MLPRLVQSICGVRGRPRKPHSPKVVMYTGPFFSQKRNIPEESGACQDSQGKEHGIVHPQQVLVWLRSRLSRCRYWSKVAPLQYQITVTVAGKRLPYFSTSARVESDISTYQHHFSTFAARRIWLQVALDEDDVREAQKRLKEVRWSNRDPAP